MTNLDFYSFKESLNKDNDVIKEKRREFFDSIDNEKVKENIKSYFSFIANQPLDYFKIDKETDKVPFLEEKEEFLKEIEKEYPIERDTFEVLVTSIVDRKFVASYVEENSSLDKDLDESTEEELQEKYNEFMKLEPKTFDKLLSLPRKVRIKLCTKQKVNIEEIRDGEVNSLIFDFKFGKNNVNREIYLNTTAGQLLPAEVKQVIKNGVVYYRSGELGEFFTENNKRLTIHQDTRITISKLQSREQVINSKNAIKEELNIEDEKNISLEDSIKLEAKVRGINPEFAVIAFSDTLKQTPEDKRTYVLENMLTEFDRVRGKDLFNKKDSELLLLILNKYNGQKFKEKAVKLGITEEKITKFEKRVNNFNKYHTIKNLKTHIDLNEYNGAATKIMGFAIQAYKNKDILGAAHCTDWVNKVFLATTGKRVYDSQTLFSGTKKIPQGTGIGVKEYASRNVISQIKGGDHIMLDKPRHGVYGVGRTHSVIALESPKDGIVKVVSYPNSKIPPRIEYYDLYGLGRTGKNGKPIRIQRATGEGLSSYPKPKSINAGLDKQDNLDPKERERILSKAPEYLKNLVRKYFPEKEFENALLTCYGESSYNPNAVNVNRDKYSSIDRGLFQINDHWHKYKYKGQNIFDPEVNIKVAAKIFKQANNSWKPWHAATKIGLV